MVLRAGSTFSRTHALVGSLLVGIFCGDLVQSVRGEQRLRTVVMTDIGGDPDDQQSMVRFLLYCNEWDVEGLYATPRWKGDVNNPEKILERIDAYEDVLPNLRIHAEGYPDADRLRAVVKPGLLQRGMNAVGDGKSTPASRHLTEVIDREDDRPVWIQVWGAAGDLAQALWDVRATRSPAEVKAFLSKIRVYDIGGQDETGAWVLHEFPDLHWIRSVNQFFAVSPFEPERFEPLWKRRFLNHQHPDGREAEDRVEWTGGDFDRVFSDAWVDQHIQIGHGSLGGLYPDRHWLHEGDSPAFLYLIPNGLSDPERQWYGSWGGRFGKNRTQNPLVFRRDHWERQDPYVPFEAFTGAVDSCWSETEQVTWKSHWAALFRWREPFQNDFAARMDWCIADTYEGANHNPVAVVDGENGRSILERKVPSGGRIRLTAQGSLDPDGDMLRYRWFHYPEPGDDIELELSGEDSENLEIHVPDIEPNGGTKEAHIVLEVSDDGSPQLFAYRRIVLRISLTN